MHTSIESLAAVVKYHRRDDRDSLDLLSSESSGSDLQHDGADAHQKIVYSEDLYGMMGL